VRADKLHSMDLRQTGEKLKIKLKSSLLLYRKRESGACLRDIAPRHQSYLRRCEAVANRLQYCVRFGRPRI